MANRTETQSIESDLDPDAIFAILVDPTNLPQWAPTFADQVERDAHNIWQISKDGSTFSLEVAATPSARTLDYLRNVAPGKRGGAYLRVLPRPSGGSVVVMTIPIAPGADPQKVAATLSQELNGLIRLSESRLAPRSCSSNTTSQEG
jgi:hypothetical protein